MNPSFSETRAVGFEPLGGESGFPLLLYSPNLLPQLAQNFAVSGIVPPHFGHVRFEAMLVFNSLVDLKM